MRRDTNGCSDRRYCVQIPDGSFFGTNTPLRWNTSLNQIPQRCVHLDHRAISLNHLRQNPMPRPKMPLGKPLANWRGPRSIPWQGHHRVGSRVSSGDGDGGYNHNQSGP